MDSTTVQEIANQLGIAVDQIMKWLPAYANAQWMGYFIPLVAFSILFVVSLIGLIFCHLKDRKWRKIYYKNDDWVRHLPNDTDEKIIKENINKRFLNKKAEKLSDIYYKISCVFFVIGGISLFVLLLSLFYVPSKLIGWSTAPEIMLLKSLAM